MIKRLGNNFRRNEDGNVAMMFSVCLIGVLVSIGAAIDFSGAAKEQQSLQGIIDAATLAAAKANTTDLIELEEIVAKIAAENNVDGVEIKLDVKLVDEMVQVTGETVFDTTLMGIVGKPHMDVVATAASPLAAETPIMLSLVLDTTASMTHDMSTLKLAANELVDVLEENGSPLAMSLVPFAQYVNVGTSRKGSTWLDVTADGTSTTEEACWEERITITPRSCVGTGIMVTEDVISDGIVIGTNTYEEEDCTGPVREWTGNTICEMRTTEYNWHGCVGSRKAPNNRKADFGTTRINGIMNETCGTELVELTKDMSSIRAGIQNLAAAGETYLPTGVMWGWRSMKNTLPLPTTVDFDEKGKKQKEPIRAMLFMTDGSNTLSQGGSEDYTHEDTDVDDANDQTLDNCDAAKKDGITIYTVGYRMETGSEKSRQIMIDCASAPSLYKDAGNAAELKNVFKEIAGQLAYNRLAL